MAHLNAVEAALLAKLDGIFVEKYQREEVGRRDLQRSESLRVLKVHIVTTALQGHGEVSMHQNTGPALPLFPTLCIKKPSSFIL